MKGNIGRKSTKIVSEDNCTNPNKPARLTRAEQMRFCAGGMRKGEREEKNIDTQMIISLFDAGMVRVSHIFD